MTKTESGLQNIVFLTEQRGWIMSRKFVILTICHHHITSAFISNFICHFPHCYVVRLVRKKLPPGLHSSSVGSVFDCGSRVPALIPAKFSFNDHNDCNGFGNRKMSIFLKSCIHSVTV
jgi:hypothetical protein